ncbi:hypothetical protein [Chitinophaga jiangningensis]|nr:hypothetical protein [Chitinophaga jiangningensis]
MKPYDFKWTRFYTDNAEFIQWYSGIEIELSENELVICSTIIDADNFSVLTTRKLVTKENGTLMAGNRIGAKDKSHGDFKDYYAKKPLTFGSILLDNGRDLKYFIEVHKASMVMIHGVRTWIRTESMTNDQVEKVARIWTRQNENMADFKAPGAITSD